MKMAIKAGVSELLPVLVAQSLGSDFISGERIVDTDGEFIKTLTSFRYLSLITSKAKCFSTFVYSTSNIMLIVLTSRYLSWYNWYSCFSGGGSSLASRLRSLSAESFLQLLGAIFVIVRVMHTWLSCLKFYSTISSFHCEIWKSLLCIVYSSAYRYLKIFYHAILFCTIPKSANLLQLKFPFNVLVKSEISICHSVPHSISHWNVWRIMLRFLSLY